ncbi:hypothetical protein G7054_g12144 [Neopestalotiopsis clavispora]|nr:hypothetical protein G7054_g12144 [Neopestalotiopsis clavispora]
MPRMTYHLEGEAIASFADCSEELQGVLRADFNYWAVNYTEDASDLPDKELEGAVDETVFELWNSSDPPQFPMLVKPKATEVMVQIGVFKKDLPNPTMVPDLYNDTNNDAWTDATSKIVGRSSRYEAPPERKAHQPAFVAASFDEAGQTIIHEYCDKKGRRVPATYIDFRNDNNGPKDRLMAKAYKRSDRAWVNACNSWNEQLCIYLCRRHIFNASHTEPWNDLIEGEEHIYNKDYYLEPPQIIQEIPKIRDRLQSRIRCLEMERTTEIHGKH